MKTFNIAALFVASIALASACASQSGATGAKSDDEAVVGPPQVSWKNMTKKQKGKFMEKVVVPKMEPLFQAFKPDDYKTFDCKTCHGKGADDETFKMPNPDIEALPKSQEGWAKLKEHHPDWLKFVGEEVKPKMAALLGLPEFNPKDPQPGTVGCSACHTTEK